MPLSEELISKFVKSTNDKKDTNSETTVYGKVVIEKDENSGKDNVFVIIDGSSIKTPVSSTSDVSDDDRVIVLIKNHTATIIGNLSHPSAKESVVSKSLSEQDIFIQELQRQVDMLSPEGVDYLGASIETNRNDIEVLKSDVAELTETVNKINLSIDTINIRLESIEAKIDNIHERLAVLEGGTMS